MSGLTRCPWATAAPTGLDDAAREWGITRLPKVFERAHARIRSHDDGNGCCRVCGGPLDLDAWLDAQAEDEAAS